MIELPKIVESIVVSMRQQGNNAFVSGVATVSNTFNAKEWVNIGGTDYQIISANGTSFTVKSILVDNTYTWSALAPYFYFGTRLEIQTRLSDKDGGPTKKSQKYPMIALQVPFTVSGYTPSGGELLSPDVDGIGEATNVSVLFVADTTRDNNLPYEDRIDDIITPQLTPLVTLFKKKQDFHPQVAYATTLDVTTIPNFGAVLPQKKEKIITLDPWEVKEGIYNMTLTECE